VIVQDTGLADWLPVGAGVLTFRTIEQALRCVHSVLSDYSSHRTSARNCAADIFATAKGLPAMLDAL
jgi:hypothetical protein